MWSANYSVWFIHQSLILSNDLLFCCGSDFRLRSPCWLSLRNVSRSWPLNWETAAWNWETSATGYRMRRNLCRSGADIQIHLKKTSFLSWRNYYLLLTDNLMELSTISKHIIQSYIVTLFYIFLSWCIFFFFCRKMRFSVSRTFSFPKKMENLWDTRTTNRGLNIWWSWKRKTPNFMR